MPEQRNPVGDLWAHNTLKRTTVHGQCLLERAAARKVEWPTPKQYDQSPVEDPLVYTSIDDAFAGVLQFMTMTTRHCKRYYASSDPESKSNCDNQHCNRFHAQRYDKSQQRNPLQRSEDVHIVVQPGTYAVTAGVWGTSQQQSHVVNVNRGQAVDLDFVL